MREKSGEEKWRKEVHTDENQANVIQGLQLIMAELKIQTVHQMIIRDSIQFIHKVLVKKKPGVIFNLFCQSNTENNRDVKKYRVKFVHKSSKVTNSLFYRSLYLFNCLPTDIRNSNVKKMSKYLQENLNYIFPYNKIPKAKES